MIREDGLSCTGDEPHMSNAYSLLLYPGPDFDEDESMTEAHQPATTTRIINVAGAAIASATVSAVLCANVAKGKSLAGFWNSCGVIGTRTAREVSSCEIEAELLCEVELQMKRAISYDFGTVALPRSSAAWPERHRLTETPRNPLAFAR